ncbi:1,4-dihydroxy-6-naphthoate synthase [Acanthopleuribacter pedis]|uniref:1,4-dihydroxy-6-naphtoate synthase n=1 Tax=Acanthopleuribacter pedis TaxID=442870 RepID=A0A8J7U0B4_9BACT|nr:1,4-dihydroxy-6-naphthoate synthase [Acanthopleuribacter pedis]MBO1316893.1 1,4-dihydroxy-6-naphthoate synthase [Acanthopleuribacter pedis]
MIRLALSPCPNDTFAFYGLLHGKTSFTETIDVQYADIEALNGICLNDAADICKISFGLYPRIYDRYQLLEGGSALGFGCGPLIVAREPDLEPTGARIAVPGANTTAKLLLDLYTQRDYQPVERVFDQIMPACEAGEVDAGLIIHESRFTYQTHGLHKRVDLGEWWERVTGHPIPLGGIVAHQRVDADTLSRFDAALRESIDYAWRHQDEVVPFMRRHAQEMERSVMEQHVALYVNDFTRALGQTGRDAVANLVLRARELDPAAD